VASHEGEVLRAAGPERATAKKASRPAMSEATSPLVELQMAVGNRAVTELLTGGQAKLQVGAVGDPAEQEADTVAQAVLRRLAARSAPGSPRSAETAISPRPLTVSRRAEVGRAGGTLRAETASAIEHARGNGTPLDQKTGEAMGSAFGTDFGGVRLHSGPAAAELNEKVQAKAFTVGSDIFFRDGLPNTKTAEGQGLLAHELAHTLQQGAVPRPAAGAGSSMVRRFPASALTDPPVPPVNWVNDTASVTRSTEGLSGGVFFVKTRKKDDPIQSLVVKPNFGKNVNNISETPEQLIVGDRVISQLLGISTPASRIVPKGSPEFDQIVRVTRRKDQRPTDPMAAASWKPMTEAEAVIVMGAVQNAISVSSLANKSSTDKDAYRRLFEAVFDPQFLRDIGKLLIADTLIGNDDRMANMKMNLGNILVSSVDGTHQLVAIDTRTDLPEFDPQFIVNYGSGSILGMASTKVDLARDSAEVVDDFFGTLQGKLKSDVPVGENGFDPAQHFLDAYNEHKQECVQYFEEGRNEAFARIQQLVETKEGRAQMKGVLGEVQGTTEGDHLKYGTMKTHARYLSGRGKGQSHEESSRLAGSYAALKWLARFDPTTVRMPDEEFGWTLGTPPNKDAFGAALDQVERLPDPDGLKARWGKLTPAFIERQRQLLSDAQAHLEELGTKSRGLFTKNESSRNRVVAGRYVINAHRIGYGSTWARRTALLLVDLGQKLELAVSGEPTRNQAGAALRAALVLQDAAAPLLRELSEYEQALTDVAGTVVKFRHYGARDNLAAILRELAKDAGNTAQQLSSGAALNAPRYVELLAGFANRR
jgi:hypothetical protein